MVLLISNGIAESSDDGHQTNTGTKGQRRKLDEKKIRVDIAKVAWLGVSSTRWGQACRCGAGKISSLTDLRTVTG